MPILSRPQCVKNQNTQERRVKPWNKTFIHTLGIGRYDDVFAMQQMTIILSLFGNMWLWWTFTDMVDYVKPISQIPQCAHEFTLLSQSGSLWDMGLLHFGICATNQLIQQCLHPIVKFFTCVATVFQAVGPFVPRILAMGHKGSSDCRSRQIIAWRTVIFKHIHQN